MVHGISKIVDYLLAQVQQAGEMDYSPGGSGQGRRKTRWLKSSGEWDSLAASGSGLSPEAVIDLVSQDMLSEEEMPFYFPAAPVEMPGIVCHRLAVFSEPGVQPLVLTIYYNPGCGLSIDRPRYVVDNDVWVENSGRFWSFISIVTGNGEEARQFVEAFISRLGLLSSFEVTREGDRLSVARIGYH